MTGALSFGANFKFTDQSFLPAYGQDPAVNTNYMGDDDMAVADNRYFFCTWGDCRLGNAFHAGQPGVRFARIPVRWPAPPVEVFVPVSATEGDGVLVGAGRVVIPEVLTSNAVFALSSSDATEAVAPQRHNSRGPDQREFQHRHRADVFQGLDFERRRSVGGDVRA